MPLLMTPMIRPPTTAPTTVPTPPVTAAPPMKHAAIASSSNMFPAPGWAPLDRAEYTLIHRSVFWWRLTGLLACDSGFGRGWTGGLAGSSTWVLGRAAGAGRSTGPPGVGSPQGLGDGPLRRAPRLAGHRAAAAARRGADPGGQLPARTPRAGRQSQGRVRDGADRPEPGLATGLLRVRDHLRWDLADR